MKTVVSFGKVSKYFNRMLDSKWLNLSIVGGMFYLFYFACVYHDFFVGFCNWYLIQNNMIEYNTKSLCEGC